MSSSPAPSREGSFVILWAGENPVLHTTLLEKLDAAGIPYVDKAIGEDEVAPTADPLPIDWKPRFGFEVAVLSTDLDAAKAILDPLLDLELEPIVELPVKDDAVVKEQPPPESIAETATFQVWSTDEGIPHKTVRRADHLFNLNSRSAFQIGIPFSFFEKAEAAVKEAYGSGDEIQPASGLLPPGTDHLPGTAKGLVWLDERLRSARAESELHPESAITELPEEPSSWGNAAVSHADWDPQDWYPEDATVEVWSGDQPELGEMIAASLQENQIHSRRDSLNGRCALFVLPEDEARSGEIVREIIEAAPPE